VPKFEFRYGPDESMVWVIARAPEVGEEIVFGYRGVFRVIGVDDPVASNVEAEYAVARIRDATRQEVLDQFNRGVNRLPPRNGD
jgi:hypothetical protein